MGFRPLARPDQLVPTSMRSPFSDRILQGAGHASLRDVSLAATGFLVLSTASILIAGPTAFVRLLQLQLLLVLGSALLFFFYHRPQAGLLAVVAAGLVVAPEIGTGTQSGLNGALLLAPLVILLGLLRLLLPRERPQAVSSPSILPLYGFMASAVLAMLVGQYPWFPKPQAPLSAQAAQLGIFLFSGGLFLVAVHHLRNPFWLKAATYSFIALGSIHLAARLLPGASGSLQSLLPRAVTMGSMFWTWLVALSAGQALFNRDLGLPARLVMAGISAAALGIGFSQLQYWISGWFPALLALFVILALRYPAPTLLAAPAAAALGLFLSEWLLRVTAGGDNLYSYETRLAALQSLLPIISANPLLGLGPANYYQYTALYPIMGWYVSFNSHNNYLDIVAQTGFVGLTCFLWFAGALALIAFRLLPRAAGGFERAYVYSVLAGLAATLAAAALGDWLIPFVYNAGFPGFRTSILPWVFLGGLVALEQRRRQRA